MKKKSEKLTEEQSQNSNYIIIMIMGKMLRLIFGFEPVGTKEMLGSAIRHMNEQC